MRSGNPFFPRGMKKPIGQIGLTILTLTIVVLVCMMLAGCVENGRLQRLTQENEKLQIENSRLVQELSEMKNDWKILQDENESARLLKELRSKIIEAEKYKASTEKQLNLDVQLVERLKSENAILSQENQQSTKTIRQLRKTVDKYRNLEEEAVKQHLRGLAYPGVGRGHWIREVSSGGAFVTLEDGSIWEISPIDRITTALWLPVTNITVIENRSGIFPYILINTDDSEKAEAKYMGR